MNTPFRPLSRTRTPLQIALTVAVAMAAAFWIPSASAQTSGLVAAYSFDEGAGSTAADSSGSGNNGTLVSGASWSTTAKFGAAANFDGSNDRIDVPDSNSLDLTSGMTLEAWVRPTANSSYRTVVLKEITAELSYSLYAADSDHSGRPSGWNRIASVSRFADGTGALPLNAYSHIAVTYNGASLVFYVNGVQTTSTAVTGSIQSSSLPLRIGGNAIWGEYFQGQIDEVRVYNRPLSQSEIQVDMVTPISGAPDTAAPSVSVTAPANGATVSGTATLSASAADNVGVVGVQFRVDGVNFGTEDTSVPYSRTWDSLTAVRGTHLLTAVARDAAGNTTTSGLVTVTVDNTDTIAPSVSFTSPASSATVSGTVTVAANASDNVGVVAVQFRLDGGSLGAEDLSAPYSISWTTGATSNGAHVLTAVARDAAGRTATATRSVTVSNTGGGTALTIDGNQRFQTIDGFGVSANSASWNNGELRPAIDRLIDDGGSTIWRVIIDMADWEATNDDASPTTFNWTYYNTIYSSPKFEELWSTLAYLNQKGITSQLMLNFMGRGPTWMGGADLPTSMEDEWVETVASVAYYARNNRHIQFGIFAPNNEPDWDGLEGIRMDRTQHARVMRKLAQKLDAIGLGDLRLLGPDTAAIASGVNAYLPSLMGESAVMAKMDHFAFHNYAGDSGGADSAIRNSAYPSRNFWITEVSNSWDALTHMSQGPAAILVWDGYDSVYNHAILAGRGSSPPNDAGNGPALLAYSTSTHLYSPRKAFYEFAQLFKFVPAGSVRVAAAESSSNVTIYAFHHPATDRVTLVGRNAGSSNVTFSGRLSNLPVVPSFEFYRTNSSLNMQRGADLSVTDGAFSFVASGNSVFTLTYAGPADAIPPSVSVTTPLAGAPVSGTITVSSATAVDNVGIHGVQFMLDGKLLGVEDTSAPYSVQWNTADAANGAHSLVSVARDERGNVTTSETVVLTVNNVPSQ